MALAVNNKLFISSTFWKSTFKQQLGCRFDVMDSISYFFVLSHMQLHMSWYIISLLGRLNLYFLNNVLYFSTTPVLTFSTDVVFILPIQRIRNVMNDNVFYVKCIVNRTVKNGAMCSFCFNLDSFPLCTYSIPASSAVCGAKQVAVGYIES